MLVLLLSTVSVALLFSHLSVGILNRLLHGGALSSMLVLCLVEQVVEVNSLFIKYFCSIILLVLVKLTLANLLVDPVLLL